MPNASGRGQATPTHDAYRTWRGLGETNLKTIAIPLTLVAAVALSGCGTTTGARVGTGTALGLATGAAIGAFSAQAGAGALIGAGVGALGGYLVDEHKKGNL
jgi:hypothetical protein